MGKGDKRTRKGKIFRASYGNSRPKGGKGQQVVAKPVTKSAADKKKK